VEVFGVLMFNAWAGACVCVWACFPSFFVIYFIFLSSLFGCICEPPVVNAFLCLHTLCSGKALFSQCVSWVICQILAFFSRTFSLAVCLFPILFFFFSNLSPFPFYSNYFYLSTSVICSKYSSSLHKAHILVHCVQLSTKDILSPCADLL
jgi:hypothetical protein